MAIDASPDPIDHTPGEVEAPDQDVAGFTDLPAPRTRRWYRRDKRRVVVAVRNGYLGYREACRRYRLSFQEFVDWEQSCDRTPDGENVSNADRRRHHRIAMRSPASLRMGGKRIECDVENLSATGALVLVGDSRACPTQVTLEVPHSRESLPARIAWRSRNALGVEFIARPEEVASRLDNRWIERSNKG